MSDSHTLAELEAEAVRVIDEALEPVLSKTGVSGDRLLQLISRVVFRRVSETLKPELSQVIVKHLGPLAERVSAGPLLAVEKRYGPYTESTSGLVWLHPELPYRIQFSVGANLEFRFDPKQGPENSARFQPTEEQALILLGLQTWPKLLPIEIGLEDSSSKEKGPRMLVQMHVEGAPYSTPLLRMQYSIFWTKGEEGT